jgi:hypothetical protein
MKEISSVRRVSMKTFGWPALVGAVLLASLAVACGGDKAPAASDEGAGGPALGGMVAQNRFLVFDGQRYELVNMMFENLVNADEFEVAGEATSADVDLSDPHVYTRADDPSAVYTHSAATAEGGGTWLVWRLVG